MKILFMSASSLSRVARKGLISPNSFHGKADDNRIAEQWDLL